MAKIISVDDIAGTAIVREYLHLNNESFDEVDKLANSETFSEKWDSRLYEVEFILEVNMTTGEYIILSVNE